MPLLLILTQQLVINLQLIPLTGETGGQNSRWSLQLNNADTTGQTFAFWLIPLSQVLTLSTHDPLQWAPWDLDSPLPSHALYRCLDDPCQTKVGDLAHQGCRHQDVGNSKVSVNVVPPSDEGHAFCNLHPKQLLYPQIWPSPRWVSPKSRRWLSSVRNWKKYMCWPGAWSQIGISLSTNQVGGILIAWSQSWSFSRVPRLPENTLRKKHYFSGEIHTHPRILWFHLLSPYWEQPRLTSHFVIYYACFLPSRGRENSFTHSINIYWMSCGPQTCYLDRSGARPAHRWW